MKQISPWMLGLAAVAGIQTIVIGNMLTAKKMPGEATHAEAQAEHAVTLEAIDGSSLKRIALSEKAVERIDLKTAPLGEEKVVVLRVFSGEVEQVPPGARLPQLASFDASKTATDAGLVRVRVNLGPDAAGVIATEPALVSKLDDDDGEDEEDGLMASPMDGDDANDTDTADAAAGTPAAVPVDATVRYYVLEGASHGISAGERVAVKLPAAASDKPRMTVPFSAVIYDTKAQAWVYAMTAPRTYLRQPVEVEAVVGDKAVLKSGPALGTPVVTVGVAELWGAESGMGH